MNKQTSDLTSLLEDALTVRQNLSFYRTRVRELSRHCDQQEASHNKRINDLQAEIQSLHQQAEASRHALASLKASSSWRLTAPLRVIARLAHKGLTFAKLLATGRFADIPTLLKKAGVTRPSVKDCAYTPGAILILSRPDDTSGMARALSAALTAAGFKAETVSSMPDICTAQFCFVINPQKFEELPPATHRICVQPAFTPGSLPENYVAMLKDSRAVLAESQQEIEALAQQGITYPSVFYVPEPGSEGDFHFFLCRLMMALGATDFSALYDQCAQHEIKTQLIALSLPETFERHELLKSKTSAALVFPGLRATPGWVGAACSFKYLAKKLLEAGVEQALIFEDDAEFTEGMNPEDILSFALKIRQEHCRWDVFSAFISDLHPDATISSVFKADGRQCVLLNRMVGMVCNVYSRNALTLIAEWDETNPDVGHNTIDRYLEAHDDLKIVTTCPFLVGHNEEMTSSLWHVKNSTMNHAFTTSSNLLFEKIWQFRTEKALKQGNE